MPSFSTISRAHLVRILGAHGAVSQERAEIAGFESPLHTESLKPPPLQPAVELAPVDSVSDDQRAQPAQREGATAPQTQSAPTRLWQVSAHTYNDSQQGRDEPDWARNARPATVRELAQHSLTVNPPLIPWSRLWPFLRDALSCAGSTGSVDERRLVALVVDVRPVRRIPYRQRRARAAQVHVLVDRSPHLSPFFGDQRRLCVRMRKMFGRTGLSIIGLRGGPEGSAFTQRPLAEFRYQAPQQGARVLALSDLGCLYQDPDLYPQWLRLGQTLRRRGCAAHALAPCPRTRWSREMAVTWKMGCWDKGRRLPVGSRGLTWLGAGEGPGGRRSADGLDERDAGEQGLLRLMRLCSPAVQLERGFVRDVRFLLPGGEADVGAESDLWQRENRVRGYRPVFTAEEPALRRAVTELLVKHHAGDPEILLEELHTVKALDPQQEIPRETVEFASRLVTALRNLSGTGISRNDARLWMDRLEKRAPPGLWQDERITAAWLLVNVSEDGNLGDRNLPPGLDVNKASWALRQQRREEAWTLVQQGHQIAAVPYGSGGTAGGPSGAGIQGSPLDSLRTSYREVDIRYRREDSPGREEQRRWTPGTQRSGELLARDSSVTRVVIASDLETITIEPAARPAWATAIGRNREGLYAKYERDGKTRRLLWFNPGRYPAAQGQPGTIAMSSTLDVKHGFWWDIDEYDDWRASGFRRPAWASGFGTDEFGMFADFTIESVTQRMRWIPPGRFQMGSPGDEKEREGYEGADETLHEVILTHGFWLADTACTQEMWLAVMGENPSRFKDDPQNPVENVSWETICNDFLPRINGAIPGIELGLPTEAQWEYACRSGTETPFWWGHELTPNDANYDGNYPYTGGSKGEYREKTVPVKTFRRNPWGLWQMHGNVWEWCADWFGTYPRGPDTDPLGPEAGSYRVLRGGGWDSNGRFLRSAYRGRDDPSLAWQYLGFRLARGHGELRQVQPAREAERSEASEVPPARRTGEAERSRSAAAGGRNIFKNLGTLFRPNRPDK